jgi:hypothetical protein
MDKLLDRLAQKIVDRLIRHVGMDGVKVAIVNVQPGDLVIIDIQSEGEIPEAKYASIEREWSSLFPNNRVQVTNGFNLSVIHAPTKPLSGRY